MWIISYCNLSKLVHTHNCYLQPLYHRIHFATVLYTLGRMWSRQLKQRRSVRSIWRPSRRTSFMAVSCKARDQLPRLSHLIKTNLVLELLIGRFLLLADICCSDLWHVTGFSRVTCSITVACRFLIINVYLICPELTEHPIVVPLLSRILLNLR